MPGRILSPDAPLGRPGRQFGDVGPEGDLGRKAIETAELRWIASKVQKSSPEGDLGRKAIETG